MVSLSSNRRYAEYREKLKQKRLQARGKTPAEKGEASAHKSRSFGTLLW